MRPVPLTRRVLLLLAAGGALLAGCGFHLQGRLPLPPSLARIYIDAPEKQSDFVASLRAGLLAAGAVLVDQAPAAGSGTARIRVLQDEVQERVLTVSARNIPTDYELTQELHIAVDGPDGKELMPSEDLSLTRVYSFDERKLLAKEREKDLLLEALARDMASVVLRRLSAL
jgi:LPS-assembly lipoprotein